MERFHDMLSALTMMAQYPAGTVFIGKRAVNSAGYRAVCMEHATSVIGFGDDMATPEGMLVGTALSEGMAGTTCWACSKPHSAKDSLKEQFRG